MSTTAELIASAADLWGSDGHVDDPLDALVRASNLLGADRAVSNFCDRDFPLNRSWIDC